jgi:hypothetical protein
MLKRLSNRLYVYLLLVSGYARALVKSILNFVINNVLYAFCVDFSIFKNSLNIDVIARALFCFH